MNIKVSGADILKYSGDALIVNLPGSPKAVRENLEPVLPALEHGLCMLLGTKNECASQPKARI